MNQPQIFGQLKAIARVYLSSRGLVLNKNVDSELETILYQAASTLADFPEDEQATQLKVAEYNILRLIDLVIATASEIKGSQSSQINLEIWNTAKLRFCPCPPFC